MPKVFISYSHKDEDWKNRLQTQLEVLEMEGLLSVWEDRQIEVGNLWLPKIELALNTADVAILLISADFLTSKFIRGQEVLRLLERREKEGIRIIPLILTPCPWQLVSWLSALQGATLDNSALSGLTKHQQDEVMSKLATNIHHLLQSASAHNTRIKQKPSDIATDGQALRDSSQKFLVGQDIHHQRLAKRLLEESPALYQALVKDFSNEYPRIPIPNSSDELVQLFANCPAEEEKIRELFYWVRRALSDLASIKQDPILRKSAEEAAAALYCLAAIQIVNQNVHESGNKVIRVPRSESIICAIIATALFGGELRLLPAEQPGLPRPEYVFEIQVPTAGDQMVASFERAVFTTFFQNTRSSTLTALDSEPLNEQEIKDLAARFRTIKTSKGVVWH